MSQSKREVEKLLEHFCGMENERIWLEELEKGQNSAFRVLFVTFYAHLCAFARKYVDQQVVAEDIVQDILYDLWLRKLHFENLLALKAYLYSTVRNRCLDVLKHRKVEERYFTEQRHKEDTDFFLHQILEEEVYVFLKEAIAALPEQTAKIYLLALEGYDNAEIADILHLTLDAVKAHKKRGKKILQEKLKGFIYLFVLFR